MSIVCKVFLWSEGKHIDRFASTLCLGILYTWGVMDQIFSTGRQMKTMTES